MLSSGALLHSDEETDMGVYGAYLRAQSDTDLLDIALHLDPVRYPARCDSAGRELHRRGLLHTRVYTPQESALRQCALAALALALALAALTGMLTSADAAGPSWPTGDMLPDGTRLGAASHLYGVALLRGLVVWSAHLGLFLLLLLLLGGWTLRGAVPVRRRRARADVWRLALGSSVALLLALGVAAGPRSSVPDLFIASADAHTLWQRTLPLWDPFASAPRLSDDAQSDSPETFAGMP